MRGMATSQPTAPPTTPLTPSPIHSIQPGGGLCVSLERAWGRWRRFWLRRLRPGYVRRMATLRQGHCPDCCHDVIDARDLKLFRNVCGYSFRPEDDRFHRRGRLGSFGLARAGLAEVLCFSLLFVILGVVCGLLAAWVHALFWIPVAVAAILWLFVLSFFRDPERVIPTGVELVVSPADGTVTHVTEVSNPDFPDGRAFLVGIFLSVFNVHVNRVPCAGRVVGIRYFPGCFLDARRSECAVRNEQLWIDLEDARTGQLVRVKQIAGAIARRIVCWLRPNEEVRAGERLGMIKFGSRTELYVPAAAVAEIRVKVGDKVKGGSTVLLTLRGPETAA